jgi:7-cyano-7-deazaguanine synthase
MKRAAVLPSGGLDPATHDGFERHAPSVNYGQRHQAELAPAIRVAVALHARRHRVIAPNLETFGDATLTDSPIDVPTDGTARDIPVTRIADHNTLLLPLAFACAEVLQASAIFIGCAVCGARRIICDGYAASGIANPMRYQQHA